MRRRMDAESRLTPDQLAALRSLLARLIPADDFAGALGAGVDGYILGQLGGDCAAEAAALGAGLTALDRETAVRHGQGASFSKLGPGERDALVRDLESGTSFIEWPREMTAQAFIGRMVELAHEGFYADPGNGGNRGALSWRMIRYETRRPEAPETAP
jgi:gluconate 2-dehydrogenase gamma chain